MSDFEDWTTSELKDYLLQYDIKKYTKKDLIRAAKKIKSPTSFRCALLKQRIILNNDVLLNILLRADPHTVNNIILSYRYFYDQYNSLWMQKCKQDDLLIINTNSIKILGY